MSQNQPKGSLRGFSVLRHPNRLLLEGMNNRNVTITQRFHSAPHLRKRADRIFTEPLARMLPRDFAFWAKSLRGAPPHFNDKFLLDQPL